MRIKVEKIIKSNKNNKIQFSSIYGGSSALWVGKTPVVGEIYDVELEIDDDLVWGVNIYTTTKASSSIALEEGVFVVIGTAIKLEEDGCLSMAVGDSVVLLDVKNAPKHISGPVECRASDVKVYSTNV
ncbi:hypothetical protein [Thauera butanivorans]|jgi:hypothetical protein|uniref:hypothetical protein n=1 Tax=Thauera butanivorans TaxID=86174 RepID=UPI000ADFD7B2|nr:hypothetical protein [Thauera butanivorans]